MKFRFILLYLIYAISIFSQNIYVVYDETGSMKKDERWIYANYAIQNLVSMLSEEDKIFLVKMSDYKKSESWCPIVDALYWRFLHKHSDKFSKNPRMAIQIALLNKMPKEKLENHLLVAKKLIDDIFITN